eukprot:14946995-Ditylum_brightwellii.AAC.1
MQASASQASFSANNVYYDPNMASQSNVPTPSFIQSQTAKALAQLAAATEEDCSMFSNLTNTNSQLMEQVANITQQMSQKDSEIAEP